MAILGSPGGGCISNTSIRESHFSWQDQFDAKLNRSPKVQPRMEQAVNCFALIANSYDIDINQDGVSSTLKVGPMLEAELFAVLLNVLSNAIKSVIAAGGPKRIELSAERHRSKAVLHVRDSGIGLDEQHFENVFAPFAADPDNRLYRGLKVRLNPEDQYLVGTGSGLGLSIVREILAYREGDVRFVKPTNGWKADIEIELP